MSTNYTEHLGLSLWEADDPVLRTEFNANHTKLDDALRTLTAAHACVTGTYEGGADPDRVTIDAGFQPSLAIIMNKNPSGHASDVMCTIAIGGCYVRLKRSGIGGVDPTNTLTAAGFELEESSSNENGLNVPGLTYYYALFH